MLTDIACRKAKAQESDYRLPDEKGLYLLVLKSGHKSWRLGYWFDGKKKRIVLGSYPEMSLQDARAERDAARSLVARGRDPAVVRLQESATCRLAAEATFKAMAGAWLEERKKSWAPAYGASIERLLRNHLYPGWENLPLSDITKPMVAQRLKSIEGRGLRETARRAREKIVEIYDRAQAMGYDVDNPGAVKAALQPAITKRRPAHTDLEKARAMLRAVEAAPAHPITKLASRFIALTVMRPGTVQLLPWAEIIDALEADDPVWTIPAERMKLTQERKRLEEFDHLVPLARQSIEVLRAVRQISSISQFVFHSTKTIRRPISDSTVSKLYRDNGFRDVHVPHGWRSTFSTIMNERAMAADRPGDRLVIDLMLAHQQQGVEPIYNRSAYMPRRRELAQEWADLLLEGMEPAATLLRVPIV